jgi:hypothetical protein
LKSDKNGNPFRFTFGTNNLEMIPNISMGAYQNYSEVRRNKIPSLLTPSPPEKINLVNYF